MFELPRSIDVTPDGKKLAVGSAEWRCRLRSSGESSLRNHQRGLPIRSSSIKTDRLTFSGHYSLGRFSPDGKILAVVMSDKPEEVRLYDAETGRDLRKVALASRLVRLAFSPDGKQLATTDARQCGATLRRRNRQSGLVARRQAHRTSTKTTRPPVAFSPDGKIVAACATDNRIYLMNPSTGEEIAQLTGHHWYPWALAFTANSKMLYSSGWDDRRYAAGTSRLESNSRCRQGADATGVVAASPDGQTLAYEDDSGTIRLVDAEHGTERRTLALPGTEYSQLAFSADGRRLAGGGTSGDQVHVAVWDVTERGTAPPLGLAERTRSAFDGRVTLLHAGR